MLFNHFLTLSFPSHPIPFPSLPLSYYPFSSSLPNCWTIRDDVLYSKYTNLTTAFRLGKGAVPTDQKTILVTVAHEGPPRVHCCVFIVASGLALFVHD